MMKHRVFLKTVLFIVMIWNLLFPLLCWGLHVYNLARLAMMHCIAVVTEVLPTRIQATVAGAHVRQDGWENTARSQLRVTHLFTATVMAPPQIQTIETVVIASVRQDMRH